MLLFWGAGVQSLCAKCAGGANLAANAMFSRKNFNTSAPQHFSTSAYPHSGTSNTAAPQHFSTQAPQNPTQG